jgi:hypothetical protein
MKVHIVTDRIESDRILPRLAKYLAVGNGWSISEEPDITADINYFNNYGTWAQKCRGWHGTKTAAYFSHLDTQAKAKETLWHEAAKVVDICITTAKMYHQYLPDNKIYQCRPPVEIDKFTIKPLPKLDKPVVGVMGFVYGDGRKGERLFEQLAGMPLAQKLRLRATGRGWSGIRCEYHEWDKIQEYFQSLDVLLCPSLFEGVPMPPLEAMACGVKAVLPEHVGIVDELPDVPGIYRYECGNVKSMAAAVEQAAFARPIDRNVLRQVILDNYTVAHWCADHRTAINSHSQVDDVANLPDWHGNAGVYVVAFGEPSRKCAKRCINSVHAKMPGLPVCLVAETPLGLEDIFIQQPDADAGGRIAKLKVDELAPADWRYVLYLDADTEVIGDISQLFDVLQDGWEFVICKDNNKYGTVNEMKRPDNLDECQETWGLMGSTELLQYNGGMMSYRRNSNTAQFFRKWQEEWIRYGKRDQGALLRALYDKPLRMFVLMNQFNATTRYTLPPGEIAILHHNTEARRWNGIIQGRIDGPEAWRAVERFNPKVKA